VRSLIFDLDGVLVDSSALYAEVLGEVLGRAGHAATRREIVAARVPHVPGWVGGLVPPGAPVEDLAAEVRGEVAARSGELAIRPSAGGVLSRLSARHDLTLLTNSSARFAAGILERRGLAPRFRRIVTSDDGFPDKAAAIEHVLEACGRAPGEAAYVGDTLMDVAAARQAGCRVVILYTDWSWDHGRRDEIEEARPDAVASSLEEVAGILERWWA
jgi:phosphoglycolate phosphatase